MKAFVHFDASVDAYEIRGQLYTVTSIPGVKAVELLQRRRGDGPRFCLVIDAEDSALEDLARQADAVGSRFAGYVSNVRFSAWAAA